MLGVVISLVRRQFLAGVVLVAAVGAVLIGWRPVLVRWHQHGGRQMLRARNASGALERLRTALRLAPEHAETLLLLAGAHRQAGSLDRVEPLLRRAATLGGDAAWIQRETWLLAARSGNLREADPHLADLLMNAGDDGPDICEAYVMGYFANLRTGQAFVLIDAWEKQYPEDPQVHFMRAYLLHALTREQEAVEAYRRGLELAPGRTIMRSRMADSLVQLRQFEEAAIQYRQCAEEEPDSPQILAGLANCLFLQAKTSEAQELLQRVVAQSPEDFEAQRLLGEVLLSQGRFSEALVALQAAARLNPYHPETRYSLGTALQSLGRADEAKRHFDFVARASKAKDRLNRQLRQAIERPDDAQVRYEIGATLLDSGSPDDGARWLRNVLQLQPDHAGAHRALAAYYEGQGDWHHAVVHWKQAAAGGKP